MSWVYTLKSDCELISAFSIFVSVVVLNVDVAELSETFITPPEPSVVFTWYVFVDVLFIKNLFLPCLSSDFKPMRFKIDFPLRVLDIPVSATLIIPPVPDVLSSLAFLSVSILILIWLSLTLKFPPILAIVSASISLSTLILEPETSKPRLNAFKSASVVALCVALIWDGVIIVLLPSISRVILLLSVASAATA